MASMKKSMGLFIMVMVAALFQVSMGVVYKVGDNAGWTTMGNIDYQKYAASKTFKVGDIILFSYAPEYHNVIQVSHADYQSCTSTNPIKTYTSGNDSITITKIGHYYYLCGFPGHCQMGQKVDIRVPRAGSKITPISATSPSMSPLSGGAPSPAPGVSPKNGATVSSMSVLSKIVLVVSIFAGFAF